MSVTALHVLYKREFEPIVRPLENVAIQDGLDPSNWVYGRVVFIEPLQPKVIGLGSVGPADVNNYPTPGTTRQLNELKVGSNEFAQYRIAVLDDILLEVNEPAATARFTNREGPTLLPKAGVEGSNFAEVFVFEDKVPTVQPYAILLDKAVYARIKVWGFRYVMQRLSERPESFTVIPVAGVAPKVR